MIDDEMRKMSLSEFVRFGYLQELNRQFLHPLGLAISVEDYGDEIAFAGVVDYRDKEEGVLFHESVMDGDFFDKKKRVGKELSKRMEYRAKKLGFCIQDLMEECDVL